MKAAKDWKKSTEQIIAIVAETCCHRRDMSHQTLAT